MKNKITKIKAAIFSGVIVLGIAGVNVAASITADHNSTICWDKGYRWIEASTQAYSVNDYNGNKQKIASYTRARFEYPWYLGGGSYLDTGRKWTWSGNGKSYATTGKELYKTAESGRATTYWGT